MRIISGKYGRRRFDVPTNISARPTTDMARENLFNVLGNLLDFDGLRCLDLFAGTGAISFEMLSRGAASVTAVEKAHVQCAFMRKVATTLHDDNITVVKGDVFKFVATCARQYDFIFADPPYDLPEFAQIPELILQSSMVKPGTIVVVEHSRAYDFSSLEHFAQHRVYGKVNFSIFEL